MRSLRLLTAVVAVTVLAACESDRTMPDGHKERCIGLNQTPKPGVQYEYSEANVVWAIVLSETVVVPVIIVLDEYKCPITGANHDST